MVWHFNFLIWSAIILSSPILLFLLYSSRKPALNGPPPSPPGWPIFGHMFNLGAMPHRTLAGLKEQYGPIVWLKLGSVNTMAVLTATAATELFKSHDLSFFDHTVSQTLQSYNYHQGALSLASYGPHWRLLRRICTVELFVSKKINDTVTIRENCVNNMISWIEMEIKEGRVAHGVHVGRYAFLATFNMFGNLILSRDLAGPESKIGSEFFEAMMGIMEMAGKPNVSDAFPWLRRFDLQGLRREMDRHMGKALEITNRFVKDRLKEREEGVERPRKDFLDVLLDFEGTGKDEPIKLSEQDLNIFTMEMFLVGSETTSTTVEWVLSELISNPKIMIKVKEELTKIVGPHRKFGEGDIDNMHYLQAVVKETLRLHPPVPLLVPRKATQDTNFIGYHIPKDTQVFINVWSIGRDPQCWDEPLVFKPERFLGSSKIEFKGQHFELIPFGAGRRICPGLPLASRMVPLILGSLIHEFDWELESNASVESMDMREKLGITARKLEPLNLIPKRCE